jgi:polysaccharide pyruvyl transferase CsaB
MKRYAIFGYYGQRNAGDEAILTTFIDHLKQGEPNSHISVYSDSSRETAVNYSIDAYTPFSFLPKDVIKGLARRNPMEFIKAAVNFLRSDVVIIGGGSLFFDSAETNKWLLYYLDLIHISKKLGKKVALIGVSVGPLHHEQSRTQIKNALQKADAITVRDNYSKALLVQCGLGEKAINVFPDLVFTLSSASQLRIEEILKAENLSTTHRKVIALTPCCYNLKMPGWIEQYVNFCRIAVSKFDSDLWFIPMQRKEGLDDLDAIGHILDAMDAHTKARSHKLAGVYRAEEVQGVIGSADFVFAERLHGSIMALNTETPCMGISYMPKVAGVLELAGLSNRIVSMNDFLSGSFINKAEHQLQDDLSSTSAKPSRITISELAEGNFCLLARI